jgi:hypothetical protein
MKRLRTKCICGFMHNQKHSLWMASGSSQTEVTNVCGEAGELYKKMTMFVLVYLLYKTALTF